MRDFPLIVQTATQRAPFSSVDARYRWEQRWCDRCQHPSEILWRNHTDGEPDPEFPAGCTVREAAAYADVTPAELTPDGADNYRCAEFVGLRILGGDA